MAFHGGDAGPKLVHSVLHLWLKKRHCAIFFLGALQFSSSSIIQPLFNIPSLIIISAVQS